MLPTLNGRIQTRLFLLLTVGVVVTFLVTPFLPVDGPLDERYGATFGSLLGVAVLSIGWELLYHLLMQWRWEKDWPTLFGLLTGVPEGLLLGFLAVPGLLPWLPGDIPPGAFVIHFVLVWLAVWISANGPLRVLFVHWRFRGGRVL